MNREELWSAPTMRGGTTALKSISPISYCGSAEIYIEWLWEAAPIDTVLLDIERCMRAGLIYPALHLALSVPDVCSSLETAHDEQARFRIEKRYVAWCKTYLGREFTKFTAGDCWALRGGVLHNGIFAAHSKSQYDRVVFTVPNQKRTFHDTIHRVKDNDGKVVEKIMHLDAEMFCKSMIRAARRWYGKQADHPMVMQNIPHLVRLRHKGKHPHPLLSGSAFIA